MQSLAASLPTNSNYSYMSRSLCDLTTHGQKITRTPITMQYTWSPATMIPSAATSRKFLGLCRITRCACVIANETTRPIFSGLNKSFLQSARLCQFLSVRWSQSMRTFIISSDTHSWASFVTKMKRLASLRAMKLVILSMSMSLHSIGLMLVSLSPSTSDRTRSSKRSTSAVSTFSTYWPS